MQPATASHKARLGVQQQQEEDGDGQLWQWSAGCTRAVRVAGTLYYGAVVADRGVGLVVALLSGSGAGIEIGAGGGVG